MVFQPTDSFFSQAIVLASILAGFGLAITAQIATAERKPANSEYMIDFLQVSSFGYLVTVIIGMFASGSEDYNVRLKAMAIVGVSQFIFLITFVAAMYFITSASSKYGAVRMMFALVAAIGVVVIVGILDL